MNVGVCRLTLRLPENQSLKGKRRVVHSINARIRNKFNVSVAEVADNELWQLATIGFACVSNDSRHLDEVLSNIVSFIESTRGDVELVDCQTEILNGF